MCQPSTPVGFHECLNLLSPLWYSVPPCGYAGRRLTRFRSTALSTQLVLPSGRWLAVKGTSVSTDALSGWMAFTLQLVNSGRGSARDFHRGIIVPPERRDGSGWLWRYMLALD